MRGGDRIEPARGGFAWVLGSTSQAQATQRVAAYRQQGFRAGVVPAVVRGRTVHRIALGQFRSAEDAERARAQLLPDAPADAWVLRLTP